MPRNYVKVADRVKTPAVREGEAVPMPDSSVLVYRDRAGEKRGGGNQEATTYLGHVAKMAQESVKPEPVA